jgi:hypothetical protein
MRLAVRGAVFSSALQGRHSRAMLSFMPDSEDVKIYLEYLDKEMTIMGVLSTFCVAAVALIIDKVNTADKPDLYGELATMHPVQVYLGCALLLIAGLCFYLQRSRLAHYYSSICISIVNKDATEWDTKRWLTEVYTFYAWMRYRVGFQILALVPIIFGHAVYQSIYKTCDPHWRTEYAIIIVVEGLMSFHNFIYFVYRYDPRPWANFPFRNFSEAFRNRTIPPYLRGGTSQSR